MRQSIGWIQLTTFLAQVVNLAHQQIFLNKFVFAQVEQLLDDFAVAINVKKVVLVKLLFAHQRSFFAHDFLIVFVSHEVAFGWTHYFIEKFTFGIVWFEQILALVYVWARTEINDFGI